MRITCDYRVHTLLSCQANGCTVLAVAPYGELSDNLIVIHCIVLGRGIPQQNFIVNMLLYVETHVDVLYGSYRNWLDFFLMIS